MNQLQKIAKNRCIGRIQALAEETANTGHFEFNLSLKELGCNPYDKTNVACLKSILNEPGYVIRENINLSNLQLEGFNFSFYPTV